MVLEKNSPQRRERRRERGLDLHRKNIVLDSFVIKMVDKVAKRDNRTFSAALCSMVVEAALNEPELEKVIQEELDAALAREVAEHGYYPEIASVVSSKVLGGHSDIYRDKEVAVQ